MPPYKILIASVLKPVNDIRMSYKLGVSLAALPGAEVHIAGHCAADCTEIRGLTLHPLFCFDRLSPKRATANATLLRLLKKLKPDLLIVGTHELLPAAALAKAAFGCRIIYDIMENYYLNIRYTSAFPAAIRKPLAWLVRTLEHAANPIVDYYLLAEKTYLAELPFLRKKVLVIENKYLPAEAQPAKRPLPVSFSGKSTVNLLYSGTIALTYGIAEAIALAHALHRLDARYRLTIIGYAPQQQVLAQVQKLIGDAPYIELIGGSRLVPYPHIRQEIERADIGLLPYRPNPSTAGCIPTRLYEYLANSLPMLVQQNPVWAELVTQWEAGFMIDFASPDPAAIHRQLMEQEFYLHGRPTNVTWKSEEAKLLELIVNLKNYNYLQNI